MKTVTVSLLSSIFYPVLQLGISKSALLSAAGLDPDLFSKPDNRVPCRSSGLLLKTATEMANDETLPLHLGQQVQPTHFSVFGYLMLNAPNIREVYARCLKYQGLVGDGLHIDFEENGKEACVTVSLHEPDMLPYRRYVMEFHFAVHVTMQRQFLGKIVYPLAVYFEHSAPEDLSQHRSLFNCELYFGAGCYKMVFPSSILDENITHANPQLYAMFQKIADEMLSKITEKQYVSWKVSRLLLDLLPNSKPNIETVAGEMALGVRTLQRKLRDEGFSFNELLTKVRKEMAIQHLGRRQLSIAEISYLLGFSEPSVFHRSFKKWTGQTPTDYRASNLV